MSKPTTVIELVAYLKQNPFVHCGSICTDDAGPRKFLTADDSRIVFDKLGRGLSHEGKATVPLTPCRPCPQGPTFSFTEQGFTLDLGRGSVRYAYLKDADEVPVVTYVKGLTLGQVLDAANFACAHLFDESNFSSIYEWLRVDGSTLWDDYARDMRFLAVYPCRGGSEGHYVHIDLLTGTGDHNHEDGRLKHKGMLGKPLGLSKTFRGMKHAQEISRVAQTALERLM